MTLSNKRLKFIDEYLKSFNATEAARQAGYRGTDNTLAVIGYENLRIPQILDIISKRLNESAMSADEVLKNIAELARSDKDALSFLDSEGQVDWNKAKKYSHLIKSVKFDKTGNVKIELYDRTKMLELIAKYHNLFTDKVDIRIQSELNATLDILENTLDTETYERIITILSEVGTRTT